MRNLYLALGMFCVMFLVNPAKSETENNVHVIIAYDLSWSIHANPSANWAKAGGRFFNEYFEDYVMRCQTITIDYIGWGTSPFPPIQRRLSDNVKSKDFGNMLFAMSAINMEATNPRDAMIAANSIVTQNFDRTIIIFLTDADIMGERHSRLGEMVSPSTQFFGISLGSNASFTYMSAHIIPKHGQHFHANTTKEFNKTMRDILDEIGYEHCMAS